MGSRRQALSGFRPGLTRRALFALPALAVPAARLLVAAGPDRAGGAPFVVDACGAPGSPGDEEGAPLTPRDVADVKSSGITAINVTVGPVGDRPSLVAFEGICRDLASWDKEIAAHPDAFLRVANARDLETARASGRVAVAFALQDGVSFQDDPTRLDVLHHFGIRVVQPTYNGRNLVGDGCLEPDGAGLSRAGQTAVRRIAELRMLLDLSHCGRRTTRDGLASSPRPPAFTHTGCAAICDHPRNKTDEELRALANKGGVAGIYFMPYLRPSGQPTSEDVIRHVEHAIQVAGEDHVGIGTDGGVSGTELTPAYRERFQADIDRRKKSGIGAPGEVAGVYPFVSDLNTPRRILDLGDLLAKRGHSSARVEKIVGGNFVRLFREVWGEV